MEGEGGRREVEGEDEGGRRREEKGGEGRGRRGRRKGRRMGRREGTGGGEGGEKGEKKKWGGGGRETASINQSQRSKLNSVFSPSSRVPLSHNLCCKRDKHSCTYHLGVLEDQ